MFHLRATHRREGVRQPVIVTNGIVYIFDRIVFRLRGEVFGSRRPLGIVGDEHASSAGGNDLVSVEAERAH